MTGKLAAKNALFSLVILDLLVLPYFQIIVFPYSLFIIALLFYYLNIKVYRSSDSLCFALIVAFSSLSCLLSIAAGHSPEFVDYNIKSLFQLLTSFLYLFAFAWYRRQSWYRETYVIIPICIFIFYYILLMFWSVFDPANFVEIVNAIYGKTSADASDYLMFRRFPYFFSDPNSAIYFFIMSVSFLFFLRPCASIYLFLVISGIISCIASQSSGGIVALALCVFVASYKMLKLRRLISLCLCISLLLSLIIAAVLIINTQLPDNNLTQALDLASARFLDQDRSSSGFGRIYHWNNILQLPPLPVGFGHIITDGSKVLPPHSDLLGITYRHGFITMMALVLILFLQPRSRTIFAIPALVPFLINSFTEDQKLFCLYLAFLGLASVRDQYFIHRAFILVHKQPQ